MSNEDVFELALKQWGFESQIDMAIEEMSELIQALIHWKRNRIEDVNVVEELADVKLMCQQLESFFKPDLIEEQYKLKLQRLKKRLEN